MIIDFHNHVGKDSGSGSQTVEELLSSMKRYGIDKSAVFPFNNSPRELLRNSEKILDISKKEKSLIPFLRFNPKHTSAPELSDELDKGFKGIKLHPEAQQFMPNDEDYYWVYEEAADRELPVLFHSKASAVYSKPEFFLEIAKDFPKLNVVLGHFFGDSFDAMDESIGMENVYCETSIFGRTFRIKQIVEKGFEKLMFGSDSPYDDQEVEMLKVTRSGLPQDKVDKILGDTAASLLNI